jgi:hypothetical protein
LPSDCPLFNHILLSYQKHHAPVQSAINEDGTNDDKLEILKPLNGIENSKFQPLIRILDKGKVILTPADFSPAYKVCKNLMKSYKDGLVSYVAGGTHDESTKREASANSKKQQKQDPSDEYNNFEKARNCHSVVANKHTDENKSFKDKSSFGNADHAKSMGMGDGSADSLLLEDDAPVRNHNEKAAGHSSFHKRPLSHNNGVRSKSSRQKRRKKTPVNGNKPQNTLISNTNNTNSRATQDVTDVDEGKSRKLIDDSKLGNKKAIVNASNRPKSSRGNRSFDSNSNVKAIDKGNSMALGKKHKNPNFGKKKHSYGGASHFNADKLLAKYRGRGNEGINGVSASSFSMQQLEQPQPALVSNIKEKNSRNIEKFNEKAIMGSNSIIEMPDSNSQYLINSESIKNESTVPQNMSFENGANHKQRLLKHKKKHKEEANKALLNFEDMKRKILKDYVKKNGKELHSNVAHPSHHRNGNGGLISNYMTQLEDQEHKTEPRNNSRTFSSKEKELMYMSEGVNQKKKHGKKQNKEMYNSMYEPQPNGSHWTNQPLTQKPINTNVPNSKERPNSNKKHTPSKKSQPKSASKFEFLKSKIYHQNIVSNKRKSRGNIIDLNNSYVPTHKATKSSGITTSSKGKNILKRDIFNPKFV